MSEDAAAYHRAWVVSTLTNFAAFAVPRAHSRHSVLTYGFNGANKALSQRQEQRAVACNDRLRGACIRTVTLLLHAQLAVLTSG